MNIKNDSILTSANSLIDLASSGFALALHINFTTPKLLFQTYAADWVNIYSEKGFLMSDPTVLWGFENDGTKRWSDLVEMDTVGVLELAKDYGMNFGATCALTHDGTRTIGSFARSDAEFSDDEISQMNALLEKLHIETAKPDSMTEEVIQALSDLSVQVQAS